MPPQRQAPARAPSAIEKRADDLPDTTLLVAPARGGSTAHDEYWTLPSGSRAIKAFGFIGWTAAATAGRMKAPSSTIIGVLLAVMIFPDDATFSLLEGASTVVATLTIAACSAVLTELATSGLLDVEYKSDVDVQKRVHMAAGKTDSNLTFRDAWWDYTNPFDKPGTARVAARGGRAAQPAVALVPGPPELAFLDAISWADCLRFSAHATPSDPTFVLRRLLFLLGDMRRDETRRLASARCRVMASFLCEYAAEYGKVDVSSPLMPRILPRYINSVMTILPEEISEGWYLPSAELQLMDAQVALCGTACAAEHMLWRRIHHNMDNYPPLAPFKEHLSGAGETRVVMERLSDAYLSLGSAALPTAKMAGLAQQFLRLQLSDSISDYFTAGSSAEEVAANLTAQHESEALGSSVTAGTGGTAVAGSAPMPAKQLEKVLASADFRNAVAESSSDKLPIERIEIGLLSGVAVIMRYIFFGTAWLRTRHEYFAQLAPVLDEKQAYLSKAVALDPVSDQVPSELLVYMVGATFTSLFFALSWHELDMVNSINDTIHCATGGFLAIRSLRTGTKFAHVPKAQHYVVESCLVGIRDWFHCILLAVSFKLEPEQGYTWRQAVDKQIELIRFIQGLPESERNSWYAWARSNFVEHCLKKAAQLFKHALESATGSQTHDFFLPDGAWFFVAIERRFSDAMPLAIVRRAFPGSFTAAPVVLAGTGKREREEPGLEAPSAKKPRREPKPRREVPPGPPVKPPGGKANEPGSLTRIVSWLADGSMLIGADLFPIPDMAKASGLDLHKTCWPVICSHKHPSGKAALALCPKPQEHGGMDKPCHRRPAKFSEILRKFAKKATEAQRAAGKAGANSTKI